MSGEFDPEAAAAAATGETVVEDADDSTDDGADDSTDADDAIALGTVAASVLGPLLTAPERGPSADTLVERGIDPQIAAVLDGVIDYILELVGLDVGDTLGPAGKIAVGLSQARTAGGSGSADSQQETTGGGGGGGDLSPEAAEIVGEVEGAS